MMRLLWQQPGHCDPFDVSHTWDEEPFVPEGNGALKGMSMLEHMAWAIARDLAHHGLQDSLFEQDAVDACMSDVGKSVQDIDDFRWEVLELVWTKLSLEADCDAWEDLVPPEIRGVNLYLNDFLIHAYQKKVWPLGQWPGQGHLSGLPKGWRGPDFGLLRHGRW